MLSKNRTYDVCRRCCCCQVTCELKRADGYFTLEPLARLTTSTEYKLVTSIELDRERRDEYQLTIVCRDAGVPAPLSRSRDLTVRVADTNDHAPQFQRRSNNILDIKAACIFFYQT